MKDIQDVLGESECEYMYNVGFQRLSYVEFSCFLASGATMVHVHVA